MTLFALILELNLLVALLGAACGLARGGGTPGRRTFVMLALAVVAWCAGELLVERGAIDGWVGLRLSVLAMVTVGPLWLGLAVHTAQLALSRRLPWFPAVLAVPGLLLWLLLFVEPWSAAVMQGPGRPGPLWWVYTPYAYALILTGSVLLLFRGAQRGGSPGRHQVVIGAAALLPLAAHAAHTWLGVPAGRDPTPLTLTPVVLAVVGMLLPGSILDVRPLARGELLDHLPLGVVMADRSGMVFDVNPYAEMALALARAEAIGRSLDAILAEVPASYRVEISEVELVSRVVARFAFLHPPQGQREERAA